MKNIKKYLCAIVMMVISMTAFAQEDVFSGDWLGANKEGDLKVAFTLNCDGNWQLNPYNENARCNGFMEVNMLEPGGRESLMATYEFYVESMNGNELTLSFVGDVRRLMPGFPVNAKSFIRMISCRLPDLIKAEKMLPLMD